MDLAERLIVENDTITARPAAPLRRYIHEDLFFDYQGQDLAGLPRSVSILPFLWTAAPVVWATGLKLEVDELDGRVIASMNRVRDVLRDYYPSLPWSGEIVARRSVETPALASSRYKEAALYSVGVDSTYTALSHGGPQLLLISVWGSGIWLHERTEWERHVATATPFAQRYAGGLATIRTNFRAINYALLNTLTSEIPNWYMDVQFTMSLTGMAAPLAYLHGVPVVHFAAGYDNTFTGAHASTVRLDNEISLGDARVHHDGAELTRQDKLAWIVARLDEPVTLRVCNERIARSEQNCGKCAKCLRTGVGLAVAGADPRQFGFPTFEADDVPARFAQGFPFKSHDVIMWRDMQARIPETRRDEPLMAWLGQMDFAAYYAAQSASRRRGHMLSRRVAARVPRLHGVFKRRNRGKFLRWILRWAPVL